MNTFLPFSDFKKSALSLDRQRLGKQRSEAKSIIRILLRLQEGGSYKNHPATLMWKGHEHALIKYTLAICEEWQNRGFKDEVWVEMYSIEEEYFDHDISPILPGWFGMEELHRNHRQRLIAKLPGHYKITLKWPESPVEYNLWPVRIQDKWELRTI